jgi:tRNA pseudouridine55 synthase
LLPLCLGEASKFAQGLLDADKTYTARLCLGIMTATGDAEGAVLERKPVSFTAADVLKVIAQFTGSIEQIPPMYSALKHQGRPLYELARQGIDIERKARSVTIYELSVLGSSFAADSTHIVGDAGEVWLDIVAKVSKGTYIRTLGQDIGAALGCGAHLSALRRTAVADWTLDDALSLEALQVLLDDSETALQSRLLPVDAMLAAFPIVQIDTVQSVLFSNGGRIKLSENNINDNINGNTYIDTDTVRVYCETRFLGVAALKYGVLHPVRLIGRE